MQKGRIVTIGWAPVLGYVDTTVKVLLMDPAFYIPPKSTFSISMKLTVAGPSRYYTIFKNRAPLTPRLDTFKANKVVYYYKNDSYDEPDAFNSVDVSAYWEFSSVPSLPLNLYIPFSLIWPVVTKSTARLLVNILCNRMPRSKACDYEVDISLLYRCWFGSLGDYLDVSSFVHIG